MTLHVSRPLNCTARGRKRYSSRLLLLLIELFYTLFAPYFFACQDTLVALERNCNFSIQKNERKDVKYINSSPNW